MASLSGLVPAVRESAEYAVSIFRYMTGGRLVKGRMVGGITPTITSGRRSPADQRRLYAARASNPYPVNRPGDSAHEYGYGFDSSFPPALKAKYMPLWVEVRRYVGFRVPDHDDVHAEVPEWRKHARVG